MGAKLPSVVGPRLAGIAGPLPGRQNGKADTPAASGFGGRYGTQLGRQSADRVISEASI